MEITVGGPQAVPAWRQRQRRVPWSPHAWGQVITLASGIPVQLAGALLLFVLVLWTRQAEPGPGQVVLVWLAGSAAAIFVLSPTLTRVQRHGTISTNRNRSRKQRNF